MKRDFIKDALVKLPLENGDGELLVICPDCNGKGEGFSGRGKLRVSTGTCPTCNGAGLVRASQQTKGSDCQ